MERTTQRIVAIVIIAAIGVGATVGAVWYLNLPESVTNPYEYPGLDSKPSLSRTIKIGVLDDMSQTGPYSLGGAMLAAYDINTAGGVDIGGETYYIGITYEDTQETSLDLAVARAAVEKMIDKDPDACIGGFRSEIFQTYIPTIMIEKIPFIITGSATPDFCQDWVKNLPAYKYLFRCMPPNSDRLGVDLGYLLTEVLIPNITDYINHEVYNVTIVYEDLIWTNNVKDSLIDAINASYPDTIGTANITTVPIDNTYGAPEMTTVWSNIVTSGTTLVVPIISDSTLGVTFGTFYNKTRPNALVAGINVAAQSGLYWGYTGGDCVYEITTHGIAYANFTEKTLDFYDDFVTGLYAGGYPPIYCSIGGYDAVSLIANATEDADSKAALDIVASLEKINETRPFQGVSGLIGFDEYHDVITNIPGERSGFFSALYRQYLPSAHPIYPVLPLIYAGELYDFENLYPKSSLDNLTFPSWW